jgi:hypothetical protein
MFGPSSKLQTTNRAFIDAFADLTSTPNVITCFIEAAGYWSVTTQAYPGTGEAGVSQTSNRAGTRSRAAQAHPDLYRSRYLESRNSNRGTLDYKG